MTTQLDAIVKDVDPATATVIWLHGLGADGHDFADIVPTLNLPEDHTIRFIFPHAPVRPVTINGGYRMRAWYDIRANDLQLAEDMAGIKESQRLIDALIDGEIGAGIRPERIVLAGFSQGGAMTLFTGIRRRQALGGLMALSSYLPQSATTAAEHAPVTLTTPVLICHGRGDPIVPLAAGKASAECLTGLGYQVAWKEYLMDHSVCEEELGTISAWLKRRLYHS